VLTSVSTEGVADASTIGNVGGARAHHRHVAGVVAAAVFLLVGGVVLLVDDDEAQIGIGQKQSRARSDNDFCLVRRHRRPGALALARVISECHSAGLTPKRAAKRSRNWPVSAISGIRINVCPLCRTVFGDRFEIDFRLSRTGDAVDERRGKGSSLQLARNCAAASACAGVKAGVAKSGSGASRDRLRRQRQHLERALVDETVDHAWRHAGLLGGLGLLGATGRPPRAPARARVPASRAPVAARFKRTPMAQAFRTGDARPCAGTPQHHARGMSV